MAIGYPEQFFHAQTGGVEGDEDVPLLPHHLVPIPIPAQRSPFGVVAPGPFPTDDGVLTWLLFQEEGRGLFDYDIVDPQAAAETKPSHRSLGHDGNRLHGEADALGQLVGEVEGDGDLLLHPVRPAAQRLSRLQPYFVPYLEPLQIFLSEYPTGGVKLVGSKNWSKGLCLLKQGALVPGAMTLQVDGYGQTGDVAGKGLHMDGQGGDSPPEALRADAQPVHRL